jgi:DNA-binding MarR family transcriptional regulator
MGRNAQVTRRADTNSAEPGKNDVERGVLEQNVAFHLRLAQDASFRAFKRHTGESKLRPGWYAVMTIIKANPGVTPMALSRASGRDKSTLTPVLRDLFANGLVEQRPVPNDRRSYTLTLTEEGERRLARLTEHAEAHDRQLDLIVGDRKEELLALLRRIAGALD